MLEGIRGYLSKIFHSSLIPSSFKVSKKVSKPESNLEKNSLTDISDSRVELTSEDISISKVDSSSNLSTVARGVLTATLLASTISSLAIASPHNVALLPKESINLEKVQVVADKKEQSVKELYEIVVDKSAQRLYVIDRSSGKVVKSFIVSTGRRGFETPTRDWKVTEITPNPWWYPPKSKWARGKKPVPPGPNNPLGVLKIRLSGSTILIHGVPKSKYKYLGRPASHGCIRMRNEDILVLKNYVELGSRVRTVDKVKMEGDKVVALKYKNQWREYEIKEN